MEEKQFLFKFWGRVDDEDKFLTLKLTPAQWKDANCPNGYLFIQGGGFAIFINKRYEIVDASPDWKDWFQIYLSEGWLLQVYSLRFRVCLNLPELVHE